MVDTARQADYWQPYECDLIEEGCSLMGFIFRLNFLVQKTL